MNKTEIKCLSDCIIVIELDRVPEGLPVLILSINRKERNKANAFLLKSNLEELIKQLQRKLSEM